MMNKRKGSRMSLPESLRSSSGVTIFFLRTERSCDITLKIQHPGKTKFTEAGEQGLLRYVTLTRGEAANFAFKLAECVGRRRASALFIQLSGLLGR